jgi:hypothetical protein
MATGKRAFEAKSQASLIASILKEEPRPMRELQPLTPLLLEHIRRFAPVAHFSAGWRALSVLCGKFHECDR